MNIPIYIQYIYHGSQKDKMQVEGPVLTLTPTGWECVFALLFLSATGGHSSGQAPQENSWMPEPPRTCCAIFCSNTGKVRTVINSGKHFHNQPSGSEQRCISPPFQSNFSPGHLHIYKYDAYFGACVRLINYRYMFWYPLWHSCYIFLVLPLLSRITA